MCTGTLVRYEQTVRLRPALGGGDALHPRGAGRGAPDAVPKSGRGGIENKHSTKR